MERYRTVAANLAEADDKAEKYIRENYSDDFEARLVSILPVAERSLVVSYEIDRKD